jgi:pimeloyl-ACP methyl ester carboxylesterase
LLSDTDLRKDLNFNHFKNARQVQESQVTEKPFFDGDDTVVFVHGWNLSDGENDVTNWKKAFAETAFKRLYWQGYTGRFATFDWPTFVNSEGTRWTPFLGAGRGHNLTFNPSEFQAYRSGRALMHMLQQVPGENKHLVAHSMGNVVAAEALRQWSQQSAQPLVDTYVAMEAAISAGAYGYNGSDAYDITEPTNGATWLRVLYAGTGDLDYLRDGPSGTYYMDGAESAARHWVNVYNPVDYATNFLWRTQNLVKHYANQPTPAIGAEAVDAFFYGWSPLDGEDLMAPPEIWAWRYTSFGDTLRRLPYTEEGNFNFSLTNSQILTHETAPYEILAFLRESKGATLGNLSVEQVPFFDTSKDMDDLVDPTLGVQANERAIHSFQFHFDAAATKGFWNYVRGEANLDSSLEK